VKRLFIGVLVAASLAAAAAVSRTDSVSPRSELRIQTEERNPWNHLRLNNHPDEFQFAIVSDRTGGHRPGVFERAVQQLNLLQPEFVLSVGDLIEGGAKKEAPKVDQEWKEFNGFIGQLQMPFFYVPGNHDLSNPAMLQKWQLQFGRRYYHFIYRNVLFLLLDSEDPPGHKITSGHLGEEQIAYAKKVLEENRDVRWTIVALHRPIWRNASELPKTGWIDVERALVGRKYSVFAGHIHRYERFERQGMRYYQLATTGGSSKLRGTGLGEFDHIVWVTMKKDGPLLANIMMEGIFAEDMISPRPPEPAAEGDSRK